MKLRILALVPAVAVLSSLPAASARDVAAAGLCIGHAESPDSIVTVHDRRDNKDHRVGMHIQTFINDQRTDGCYLSYVLSWSMADLNDITNDMGPDAPEHLHIRVWLCGQRRPDLDGDQQYTDAVPGRQLESKQFNIGPSCGRQADTMGSDVHSSTWTPSHPNLYARIPPGRNPSVPK